MIADFPFAVYNIDTLTSTHNFLTPSKENYAGKESIILNK